MGVASALNDLGDITVNVRPNDYGLFNMAGNVNEWVLDVYKPLSIQDNNEFRPSMEMSTDQATECRWQTRGKETSSCTTSMEE